MKKTLYENDNKTTNQYDLSSAKTINKTHDTLETYNYVNPMISTNSKEKSVADNYNNEQIPSKYWSGNDEKMISDNELTESENSKTSNELQINSSENQSTLEDSSPLSIHESSSDSSLSSNSE